MDRPALALIGLGLIAVPVWGSAPMPVLRLAVGPAPFFVLLPAVVAAGVLGVVQRGHPVYEAAALRRLGLLHRLSALAPCAVVSLGWLLAGGTSGLGLSSTCIRNLAGYLGIGLIVLRVAGGVAAAAAPALWAVAVAVLGSPSAVPWWPLSPAGSTGAALTGAVLLALGVLVGVGPGALRKYARRDGHA